MKRTALTITAAALLISTSALAQSVSEKTGVNSTLGISPTTADFVKEAATSDMTEIAASKLGQERGNAQEKTFASQMIAVTPRRPTNLNRWYRRAPRPQSLPRLIVRLRARLTN
jgi:putative membrane protein